MASRNDNDFYTREYIENIAEKTVKKVRLYAPVFSGNLRKSIKTKYVMNEDNTFIQGFEVDALPYLDIVDKGINGIYKSQGSPYSYTLKKPPIKELTPWAKKKGWNVYALQNHLYYNGMKPKHFLRKADIDFDVNELVDYYNRDMDVMLGVRDY